MEWRNAKRFVIVLLLIINVGLAYLNHQTGQEATMNSAQEQAIYDVLAQNDITLTADLLSSAEVMYRLKAEAPSFTKEEIEGLFFDGEKTTVSIGPEKTTYKINDRVLELEGSRGMLTFPNKEETGSLTQEQAETVASEFLGTVKKSWGEYELCRVRRDHGGWSLLYFGRYEGKKVFSNWLYICVADEGVTQMAFQYGKIREDVAEAQDILMNDEVLLAFLREWKADPENGAVTIDKMEFGYSYTEENGKEKGRMYYLEPCYAIYLADDAGACFISAYTGKILPLQGNFDAGTNQPATTPAKEAQGKAETTDAKDATKTDIEIQGPKTYEEE